MSLGIINYLKTLIPHVEKKNILEDLRVTETEFQSIVLPSYAVAATFFAADKFKSKANTEIDGDIRYLMKPSISKGSTFLPEFTQRLTKIERNISILIKAIDKEIGRDIITDGASSKKIVLMRIAEKFSYVSRSSMDLLNLIYLNEASALGANASEISMSPAELSKAKASVENLARLVTSYGIDGKEFQSLIDKTPELILTKSENADLEGTYSDIEIDPITPSVLAGFSGNPIYHARMLIAEWQTKRYKANQEKKKVLELRVLHLTLLKDKQGTNPKIEQEIAYTQSRIGKLDRALHEEQEDLGIAA